MSQNEIILSPGQQIKAMISIDEAKNLVESRYGFTVKNIKELDAYDDRNYHVLCDHQKNFNDSYVNSRAKNGYTLKIVNCLDSQKTGFVEAQNELLVFLNKKGFVCPVPVKQVDGSYYSIERLGKNEQRHVLRLMVYIPGEVLDKMPVNSGLMKQIGLFAARLDKALEEFSHPAYENQTSLWALSAAPKLRDFLFALEDKNDVSLVEKIIVDFENKVLTIINNLSQGIIHGDLNENNIIVSSDGNNIEAIIDFGDSHRNCYIFELAICLCYMITKSNSIDIAKHVIEGYKMVRQLTPQEKEILKLCVCARFCQSLVLGSYSYQREPNNDYLVRAHPVKWALLKKLWPITDNEIMNLWDL